MSTPEQGGSDQYATPEEVEDLQAAADEQEQVGGGYLKITMDRDT